MNEHVFHIAMAVVLFFTAIVALGLAAAHWSRRPRRVGLCYLHIGCAFVLAIVGAYQVGMA